MQIAVPLYPGYTALDVMGPYQVFAETPGTEVVFCAEQAERLYDDHKMFHLDIEHTFSEVPRPDVLVVPGGFIDPRSGPCKVAAEGGPILDWIRAAHEHTTFTASVCTGALLLGAAGLLEGLRATTHWAAYDDLRGFGGRTDRATGGVPRPNRHRGRRLGRHRLGAGSCCRAPWF
jgi:putative intracellular protease/amidase